jgi:hypothetical protein
MGARGPVGLGRRLVEWGAFAAVLAVLVLMFLQRSADVQGQAELAAIQTTLGALRTAAVLRHVQANGKGVAGSVAREQRNPFLDLVEAPPAYLGEQDTATVPLAPGGWFYDRRCDCLGYRPLDPRWLNDSEGNGLLRYRIRRDAGPLQFEPIGRYVWQGEPLR